MTGSKKHGLAALLALALLASWPGQALAWGRAGHQAMAILAWKRLSPQAKEWVRGILGDESIEEAAIWPDLISHWRTETLPWHYINLPLARGDAASRWKDYCPENACVVAAIEAQEQRLKDPTAPAAERKDALRFLIHFIGDLHQPLHCVDDDDRGGNDKPVSVRGHRENLHQLIDDALIAHNAVRTEYVEAYIEKQLAVPGVLAQAKQGTLQDWLEESAALARERIYPLYKERQGNLSREDIVSWQPLVDRQLARATVRLAMTLEALAAADRP
jgi:hypothetical protein